MSVKQALFSNFRDVQVAQLGGLVLVKENIRTLHVPVKDLHVMQGFKSFYDLNNNLPDVLLFHELLSLLTLTNSLEAVPVVCEFHHDALTVMLTFTYHSELECSSKNAPL